MFNWFRKNKKKEKVCPKCGCGEGYEYDSGGTLVVCAKCGALLQMGLKVELVLEDARERFPEIADWHVEKWMQEKLEKGQAF